MDYAYLKSLGITPITTPQWVNTAMTPAAAGTGEYEDIRFALGAEEQTGVMLMRYEMYTTLGVLDGTAVQSLVVADPGEDSVDIAVVALNPNVAFHLGIGYRNDVEGGMTTTTEMAEPDLPYITLTNARLYTESITAVVKAYLRLQYAYCRLTDDAYRAMLGRTIRG